MKRVSANSWRSLMKRIGHPSTTYFRRNYVRRGTHEFERFLATGAIERAREVRSGMEAEILVQIAHVLLKISLKELLAALGLPRSKVERKIRTGARLSADESVRAARALIVFEQASDVFDDDGLGADWLWRPNLELGSNRPLNMLDTKKGFDRVRDLLLRLELAKSCRHSSLNGVAASCPSAMFIRRVNRRRSWSLTCTRFSIRGNPSKTAGLAAWSMIVLRWSPARYWLGSFPLS